MFQKMLEKLRWTKEFERRWIGKKVGTIYVHGKFSIKEHEKGFVIKPYGQNPIVLSRGNTEELSYHLERYFTAEKVAKKV